MERTAALRNLKLLVGIGGFEFTKGMDSLDKHVQQSSFRQGVTFSEHGQLKGRRPRFQPTVAKNSISTIVNWFAAVTCHNWERNQYPVVQISQTTTPWAKRLLLRTRQASSVAATKRWAYNNHNLMERWWNVVLLSGTSSFWLGMEALNSQKAWIL